MNTLRLFLILSYCLLNCYVYGTSVTNDIDTLHKKAVSLQKEGKFKAAFKIYKKNLTLQKSDMTKGREFRARTNRNVGMCLREINEFQKAEEYLNQAIDEYLSIIKDEASTQNYNRLGVCFQNRSLVIMHKGEFEKAKYDAQEAILWFRKADKTVNEISTLGILADICHDTKDFTAAKERCFEALKKSEKVEFFSNELLANIYHKIAMNYEYGEGDYHEAARYYLKSIELTEDSMYLAKTLNNLAFVYLKDENFLKAKNYLNQTIQLKKQIQNHAPKSHHQPHQ